MELKTTVRQVRKEKDDWSLIVFGPGGEEKREHAAVLYAGAAYQLSELPVLAHGAPTLAPLSKVRYPPVASLVLGFRRDDVAHPLDGFGMLIPEVERFHILGALFSSSLFPKRAPQGHVTITCYLGENGLPSWGEPIRRR